MHTGPGANSCYLQECQDVTSSVHPFSCHSAHFLSAPDCIAGIAPALETCKGEEFIISFSSSLKETLQNTSPSLRECILTHRKCTYFMNQQKLLSSPHPRGRVPLLSLCASSARRFQLQSSVIENKTKSPLAPFLIEANKFGAFLASTLPLV